MTEKSTQTDPELDQLCDLLDTELERQRQIVEALDEQSEAARTHDLELLDASTDNLVRLQRESFASERQRLELLRPIVARFGLTGTDQTLSNLIHRVPAPWNSRLESFQRDFRQTIESARSRGKTNTQHMRGSLRRVGRALDEVLGQAPSDGSDYSPNGSDNARRPSAAVLDASG